MLTITIALSVTWRRMVEQGRKANYTLSRPDLLIAATAAMYRLSVVTRNVDDFVRAEVPVFNPRTGQVIEVCRRPVTSPVSTPKGTP